MSEWEGAEKRRYNEKYGRRWKQIEKERSKCTDEGVERWIRQKKIRESKEQDSRQRIRETREGKREVKRERRYEEKRGRDRRK